MPEAEDVITDAARHATVFAQSLWRRYRAINAQPQTDLPALLRRIDLFITAAFDQNFPLRIAQPPAPIPFVRKLLRRAESPVATAAIPATDGVSIWLPVSCIADSNTGLEQLRLMAMQQAQRAQRGSARLLASASTPLERPVYEVLEALAADGELIRRFGGMTGRLERWREQSLANRPPLSAFPPTRRPLEGWLRRALQAPHEISNSCDTPEALLRRAQGIASQLLPGSSGRDLTAGQLLRDAWIGELRPPPAIPSAVGMTFTAAEQSTRPPQAPRSARLVRRPKVRQADERDEQASQGAWMVQTAQPHEHAEDPFGLQRPTDRDESRAAEEFADAVSELAEARLVATPDAPREVLISSDPPEARARSAPRAESAEATFTYPEWDWRSASYCEPGASVHLLTAPQGSREWVTQTLQRHRTMLDAVRRQFESLRARRIQLRQQADGEDVDLDACIDAFADSRAGAALAPGLYRQTRNARREMAVLLLIDVSGSTDAWISAHRRAIDVEREALLLVCVALEGLNEPYSVLAFSGEGPAGVTIRSVKGFEERYGSEVELRIAGLEPERYTRAGAAIRHASALLMREAAHHRLLLILSDGKPNDMDRYDGRYGVEDMRQSVVEARLQGIFTFCLTIDRHSANYLPAVFGEQQYAVVHSPELLAAALIDWLRRLVHR